MLNIIFNTLSKKKKSVYRTTILIFIYNIEYSALYIRQRVCYTRPFIEIIKFKHKNDLQVTNYQKIILYS